MSQSFPGITPHDLEVCFFNLLKVIFNILFQMKLQENGGDDDQYESIYVIYKLIYYFRKER